jgi:hypothetical protein
MGQIKRLRRWFAHAGSSGPVDPAGFPACRGWRSGKIKADRASQEVKYRETNPTQRNEDCHKSDCDSALDSFGASVGSKNEATVRGRFLFTAGRHYRDGFMSTRETRRRLSRRQELRIDESKATGSQLEGGTIAWDRPTVITIRLVPISLSVPAFGGQMHSPRWFQERIHGPALVQEPRQGAGALSRFSAWRVRLKDDNRASS